MQVYRMSVPLTEMSLDLFGACLLYSMYKRFHITRTEPTQIANYFVKIYEVQLLNMWQQPVSDFICQCEEIFCHFQWSIDSFEAYKKLPIFMFN